MNIFILSDSTVIADNVQQNAEFHCDKHVIKMIAESTQMLVTAMDYGWNYNQVIGRVSDMYPRSLLPCKPLSRSMHKHPCTLWAIEDSSNFNYLATLAFALCEEHQHRYPLSARHEFHAFLLDLNLMLDEMFYGRNEMPKDFAIAVKNNELKGKRLPLAETVAIYRDYYIRDKFSFASWKRRNVPHWFAVTNNSKLGE